jgi:hypothetical protein
MSEGFTINHTYKYFRENVFIDAKTSLGHAPFADARVLNGNAFAAIFT